MSEKIIRYKVVGEDEKSWIVKNFGLVKTYKKGFTVKATTGSLGIFVFTSVTAARSYLGSRQGGSIKRVRCFGKLRTPKKVINPEKVLALSLLINRKFTFNTTPFWELSNEDFSKAMISSYGGVPDSTECYKYVEVLD